MENSGLFNSSLGDKDKGITFIQRDFEAVYRLFLLVMIVISTVVAVSGVMTNIINIRTFYIIGLRDGITVSLFALSISDFSFLCSYITLRILSVFVILEARGVLWLFIEPNVISSYVSIVTLVSSSVSMFGVTFLAVARCLCVSMPLHFKNIFTKSRCVAFYAAFLIVGLSGYLPIAGHTGVQRVLDPQKNKTRIFPRPAPGREEVKDAVWLIFDTVLPIVFEATLIVCAFVMVAKLRESARFRQSQKSVEQQSAEETDAKLSPRDRRVVLQVLLISVIYIVANIPKIFNSLYTQFEKDFDIGKRYQNIYFMMGDVRFFCECINCTANFIVYYKFNSAFQAACFKSKDALRAVARSSTNDKDCSRVGNGPKQ